jgi:dipeptidyl-peptidase-4
MSSRPLIWALALFFLLPSTLAAQGSLTVDRIFNSKDFAPEQLGRVRWLEKEAAYVKLEADSATPGGQALVRYDAASGKRQVWISAARLVPPGDSMPLGVEDYTVSPDQRRLLIFTNSKKVWRQNTRGDFWSLDLSSWRLRKLGGPQAKPSTLMFAKFSPDGNRVAYVRENNLYVENLGASPSSPMTALARSSTGPSTGSMRRS